MFVIQINQVKYEYDIHSIVKAFYPEKQVKVVTPDTDARKAVELLEEEDALHGSIVFEEHQVVICLEERSYIWAWKQEASSLEAYSQEFKDAFKGFLYRCLCAHTGKTLPWGNMTGIRPTKIAMAQLMEGKSQEEILDYYRDKHYVSEEKALLSIEIAERERKLLSSLHYEDGYSLYIGIPFCPTTCLYCSFTSYPIAAHRKCVEQYIDCLIQEMDYVREVYKDKILDTVYIGGGTPTTLEAEQLDRLITALKERFDFDTVQEFTVEAGRADSITREKLEVLYKHGVDRISVNPQTMNQCTLDTIGRRHTVEQVVEAYHMAREIGFSNINMDLILGLPGEDVEEVTYTIEEVKKLNPDSLTVHSLAIKRASKLAQWIQTHDISCINNTDETMAIAVEGAKAMNMHPYYLYRQKNMSGNFENVGYAREGKFGIYNILIMEEKQTIVALGAGSITKRVYPDGRIERCDNVKDVELYINQIEDMIERKRMLLEQQR
ncbi:MAG: coproporphyrinogen dehydrogenase HemZ [Lachnospiraceae bacterium]|nr:coproporphyrinogen dehydrogenase HemZ [Lachnospiraceae bacterium]